ncbi:MAG: branched-chain amino acid ABC transporter substrate-binding protein [Betaproteobacteria bacterium]|nr:branched-chain amino acid ABC transporter substrate-binding protein [Betaproteobacteria bacterium]
MALVGAPATAQTIRIGFISTFSGPSQAYGQAMERGIKLYQKMNADKLPPGVKIEVITRDDGGPNPDKGKQLAQELIVRDKVHYLAGVVWTPTAMAIAPLTIEAKVPLVVMNAAASAITTRSPYITRFSYTSWQAALPVGIWAAKHFKRAYIAVSDYAPGHDSEAAFEKGFVGQGREVVGKLRMPLANPDFVPFLQRVKDVKPDVLFFFAAGGGQETQIIKTYKALGLDTAGIKIVSTYLGKDEELPNEALGTPTIYHYTSAGDRPANKAFVAAFTKEYNQTPDYVAVAAWDGMDAIYYTIREQNGKVDADRTMELLKKYKNPDSPRGPISLDPETRDIVQNMYLREVRRVGGQLTNVELETVSVAIKDPWKELNRK